MFHRIRLSVLCFAALLFNGSILDAQERQPADSELPCVVRISHDLLDELVDDQIEASLPFQSSVLGGQAWGTVTGRAQLVVELHETAEDARFIISANGTANGCVFGRRGCFRATGNVNVPFSATQVVHFDGDKFVAESLHVQSRIHANVTSITTKRNSPLGKLVGGAAQPCVNHMLPDAERQSIPVANRILGDFVAEEANSVIAELNQVTPLETTLKELYPELIEWRYRLATTDTHLIVAFGPRGGSIPVTPTPGEPLPSARIEVWIRTTREEAAFLQSMSQWNASHDLMKDFLSDEPELIDMLEDATVNAVDDWVRVGIGTEQ